MPRSVQLDSQDRFLFIFYLAPPRHVIEYIDYELAISFYKILMHCVHLMFIYLFENHKIKRKNKIHLHFAENNLLIVARK